MPGHPPPHRDCLLFVLDVCCDPAATTALGVWADASADTRRDLAATVRQTLDRSSASTMINELSTWIDDWLASRDPEAILWNRVGKVGEEYGEVVRALIGLTAANPRIQKSNSSDQLAYELLDVSLAALGAYAHLQGNQGNPLLALLKHIDHVHRRSGFSAEKGSAS